MVAGGPYLWVSPERMELALNYLHSLSVDGLMLWSPPWPQAQVSWSTSELQELWQVINDWRTGEVFSFTANIDQLKSFTSNIDQLISMTSNVDQLKSFTSNIEQLKSLISNIEQIQEFTV